MNSRTPPIADDSTHNVHPLDLFNAPHASRRYFHEHFSTGNKMIDFVLGGLTFIILMQLTNRSSQADFFSVISSMFWWLIDHVCTCRNKGEIEFLVEQVNQVSNCFTPTYRAIMYKLGTINNDKIWRFKEKRLAWYDNRENKNVKECLYQVLQTEPIEVEDDIWIK